MIEVATTRYKLENNDTFIDMISAISNFTCVTGEIVGPIIAGVLAHAIGFSQSSAGVAFSFFVFAALYFLVTRSHPDDSISQEIDDYRVELLVKQA